MDKTNSPRTESRWSKAGRPKAISVSAEQLVQLGQLQPDQPLPLVIQPNAADLDLGGWAASNRELLEDKLAQHGAILFRGFPMTQPDDLKRFTDSIGLGPMEYMESSTPRRKVSDAVYTSTEFPSDQTIALHNELSAAATFPLRVVFYGYQPAPEGGETPIADVRRVYQRIDPAIRQTFEEKGWLLVRNYGDGFGLPWQDAFHTEDRADVETYCRNNAIEFEWRPDDHLRTRQVRPAIIRHPKTGEVTWFNHIAFWHVANLAPHVRDMLLAEFGEEGLPYHTYYGDGTRIPDDVAYALRDAYLAEKIVFPWQSGDVLLVDNILVAHGRQPYSGPRKILVSLCEPYTRPEIAI